MKTIFRILALLLLLLLIGAPAHAQFANQANYAGASTGTNTIAIPLANWTRNLVGVPVRFLPANTTTGAATANVNSVGAAAILKPSNGGLTALTGGEIRASQPTTIIFDGTQWVLQGQLGTFTDASTLALSALSFDMPINLSLAASVGTNALTITLQTAAGGTPSAASPVIIPFRNSTIGTGNPLYTYVTGALSFTIASGATMGCTSGVMCRLWVIAICSSGLSCTGSPGTDTVGLCAFNARSGNNIAPINEAGLQTSGSGTSGGNSAQTYYCNISSVTSRAIRILGYIDIQEVTAGTWATSPTTVQLFGPGIKKPSEVVATYSALASTLQNVTGQTPTVATGLSVSFSPTSAANVVKASGTPNLTLVSGNVVIAKLGRAGTPTFFGTVQIGSATSYRSGLPVAGFDIPNTTGSVTYSVYIYNDQPGGVTRLNDNSGGTPTSDIVVEEIMGSLEPANDNWIEDRATA